MKRCFGSFAVAVVVTLLFAIPLAYARGGGGGGGGGGFGGGGHGGGGFGGGGWHGGGREFYGGGWGWHHHGYGYGFGGYFWGDPFWWGYPYWWWPYDYYGYYGYPPAYNYYGYPPYDYDYYGYEEAPAYQYGNPPSVYPEYDSRDYLKLGHDSGKALRLKAVSHEWLVDYIRAYVINAPLSGRDDFRRGFISGYGDGGNSVLKKAVEEARRPIPPPREAAPPLSGSSDAAKQP